ncbi:MAG: hypothetical protein PVJ11_10145 [Syntrophobacterales bacterium]|jgi:hypothetical protein
MIMRPRHRGTIIIGIGLAYLGLMMLFSGCTKRVHTGPTEEEGPTPIVTIHEFPDVPIPKELKLDQKESFVYMTPDFATGMLVYNGNVDYDSLVRFFDESLTKNGWIIQASLKYTRTLFFYQKENRVCLLTMQDTPLNVRVEIWVAPLETAAYEPLLTEPPIEPFESDMQ